LTSPYVSRNDHEILLRVGRKRIATLECVSQRWRDDISDKRRDQDDM